MYNIYDFVFQTKLDNGDYWFDIKNETAKKLTEKYMEQSMIAVTEAVYGTSDGLYGIKRIFPWNFDVICPKDEELEKILKQLVKKYD